MALLILELIFEFKTLSFLHGIVPADTAIWGCSQRFRRKTFKGALTDQRQFLATERLLTKRSHILKKTCSFQLCDLFLPPGIKGLKWRKMLMSPQKLFSFSRYLSFCLDFLVMYRNGLVKKIRLISNFMMSQPG